MPRFRSLRIRHSTTRTARTPGAAVRRVPRGHGVVLGLVLLLHLVLGVVVPLTHRSAPADGVPAVAAAAQPADGGGESGEHGHAHDEHTCTLCHAAHEALALPRPHTPLPVAAHARMDAPASVRAGPLHLSSPSRARAPPAA